MKKVLNALLGLCAIGLAYACFWSIYSDIRFDDVKTEREALVKQRLWDIRNAEEQFKIVHGYYCGTLDSLIDFVKNSKTVDHIVKEGELTDDQLESGMTERQAVKMGLIKRDTVWISAAQKLNISNPDSMKYVPVGKPGAEIQLCKRDMYNLKANEMENLVEARASLDDYLYGVDDKRVRNLKAELKKQGKNKADLFKENEDDAEGNWYGLRVGDLNDTSNKLAGNWE